jgi:hypothetical protein
MYSWQSSCWLCIVGDPITDYGKDFIKYTQLLHILINTLVYIVYFKKVFCSVSPAFSVDKRHSYLVLRGLEVDTTACPVTFRTRPFSAGHLRGSNGELSPQRIGGRGKQWVMAAAGGWRRSCARSQCCARSWTSASFESQSSASATLRRRPPRFLLIMCPQSWTRAYDCLPFDTMQPRAGSHRACSLRKPLPDRLHSQLPLYKLEENLPRL